LSLFLLPRLFRLWEYDVYRHRRFVMRAVPFAAVGAWPVLNYAFRCVLEYFFVSSHFVLPLWVEATARFISRPILAEAEVCPWIRLPSSQSSQSVICLACLTPTFAPGNCARMAYGHSSEANCSGVLLLHRKLRWTVRRSSRSRDRNHHSTRGQP